MNKNPNDMTLAELEALYVFTYTDSKYATLESCRNVGWTAQQLIELGYLKPRAINVSDVQPVTVAGLSDAPNGNTPNGVIVDDVRHRNSSYGKFASAQHSTRLYNSESAATESSHHYPIHTTESTKAAMREVESWIADSRSINLTAEEVAHITAGRSIDIGDHTITAATPPEGFSQDDSTLIPVTVTPHAQVTWTADEMAQLIEATYPWDSVKLRAICVAFGYDKYTAMIDTIAKTDAECARNVAEAIASNDVGFRASILPRADLAAVKPTWLPGEMDRLKTAIVEGDAEWLKKMCDMWRPYKFDTMLMELSDGHRAAAKVLLRGPKAYGSSPLGGKTTKRHDRYSITASVIIGVVCVVTICVLVLRSWGVL